MLQKNKKHEFMTNRYFMPLLVSLVYATASCINNWISQQDNLEPGTECARGVGMANFQLRGVTINALAQPFRFYLLKRVQDEFESLDKQQQDEVTSLLDACQMTDILKMKLSREIGRQNNLEVWL